MAMVECVPNFSEGRDPAVLASIVDAMLAVPEVYLLAQEMDADHHRAVVTLAGEPDAVAEAAVRGVGEAARLIDLRRHRGVHPRLGATDVVPFIPLEDTTIDDCVRLAHWAGAEIWRRFQIPVYLYGAAARKPDRVLLEAVRRGQFEGLREQVKTDPSRLPDFGPALADAALHPSAGATIVGARKFLIAFNINLDTDRVEVARAIAGAIRTSGGGLPALKAMGVPLTDPPRVQVSMNLTDFEQTSLATVWRAVAVEAERWGVTILESELVGLAPAHALEAAAAELLKVRLFDPDRIIENRLRAVRTGAPQRHAAALSPLLRDLQTDDNAGGGLSVLAATAALIAAYAQSLNRPRDSPADLGSMAHKLARHTDQAALADAAFDSATAEATTPARRAAALHRAELALAVAIDIEDVRGRLQAIARSHPAGTSDVSALSALADAAASAACELARNRLRSIPPGTPDHGRLLAEIQRLEALR